MDINWSKTKCMVITNSKVIIPMEITINNIKIQVVDKFKLLGVDLDNKLHLHNFISAICLQVNRKLYAIKRLFYLCFSVKLQFFKTFISYFCSFNKII